MKKIITYEAYKISPHKVDKFIKNDTAVFMASAGQTSETLWNAAKCAMQAAHGHKNVTGFTAIKITGEE